MKAHRQFIAKAYTCNTHSHVFRTYSRAVTRDFQQCGILKRVDSDKPVQPFFKLRNSK